MPETASLNWPYLTARSSWPSSPAFLSDGYKQVVQPLLAKRGKSQARGVSAGKAQRVSPRMTVAVMQFQKVFKAISWLAVSAQGTRFGGEWYAHTVIPDVILPSFTFIH